ncbi:transcription factor Zelda [Atheta coriaria]|uniref:transcription factor Zelda n=1 Tax=Dalotia coriaria TaxID=877792 RepID=UPI0031F36E28
MANNVQQYQQPPTQQQQQQQQQQPGNSSPHHCKECGLYLNSAESLDVHLQYHKENLLNKWATQATASGHTDETNNNTPPTTQTQTQTSGPNKPIVIKREFSNTIAAADSSDAMMKKSPEYGSRATPEINVSFGHPPTPQSYHSASSPYQTPDNSAFSPGYNNQPQQQQQQHQQQQQQQQSYQSFQDAQFYGMEAYNAQQQQQPGQQQEYVAKMGHQSYRYHPYQQHTTHQVTSSSPAYPPQPTPSPSPKQCDKCGYVCESAAQLIEHLNVAHPPTPNYQQNHFIFGAGQEVVVKQEEPDVQSEILDLDSHKVVHQVYPEEQDKRVQPDMNGHNPHSVSAMLSPWPQQGPPQAPPPQQQQMQSPKMFQEVFPHKFHNQVQVQNEFIKQEYPTMMAEHAAAAAYRPFEHMPPQPAAPIITSTQVPNNPVQTAPPTNSKGTNWKSNEARRPKTYNCTACNKWFTSSGHLKRHYNTTLHKNAVKSSGQPDPATMPISAHHHPARDSVSNREDHSNSPGDDSRSEDSMNNSYERPAVMPGLLQQPPAGPYDRQPAPNIAHHPHPHPLHSPMAPTSHPASPPNGEAGLSASTTNIDSRGLLSISNSPASSHHNQHTTNTSSHGFSHIPPPGHHHMMAAAATMDNQFQMYPNECAPHATQDTAATINSLSTTGEQQSIMMLHQQSPAVFAVTAPASSPGQSQPLPSFAQFNNRYGLLLGYNAASVGGPGPATVPYSTATTTYYTTASLPPVATPEDGGYKLTVLTSVPIIDEVPLEAQPASPEKAHIKRDYEETPTGSPRITSTSGNTAISQISKDGVHKCFDCDKVFNKSCYLTQHNKTFHSGDKPFKCTRCGKRFSVDEQYQEHLAKHAGDKPHKCDLCPKQFNHKTDLRRHMCLHTGQKPYACDICHKGFIRKDHMLKHCETHSKKLHAKGQAHLVQARA